MKIPQFLIYNLGLLIKNKFVYRKKKIPTNPLIRPKNFAPLTPKEDLNKTTKGNPNFWDGFPIKFEKKRLFDRKPHNAFRKSPKFKLKMMVHLGQIKLTHQDGGPAMPGWPWPSSGRTHPGFCLWFVTQQQAIKWYWIRHWRQLHGRCMFINSF